MAKDPRKRQKQLERRKAKEKARKKALVEQGSGSISAQIKRAGAAPILHCATTSVLWEQGLSHVLVSRSLSNGSVAFVAFLLDIYCLGVKDVIYNVLPRSRYNDFHEQIFRGREVAELTPEAARKLVEGAVEYAADHGIGPHRDYRKARHIFGDIDASLCDEKFTYGKDGKPFFVAGPYDGPGRCREIVSTLTACCGPDGFTYLMGIDQSGLPPDAIEVS